MPKKIDNKWFLNQASTKADRDTICRLLEMREKTIRDHNFCTNNDIITLKLGANIISVRECAASATIEVYYEIFKEDDHFLHDYFRISDAKCIIDIGANEGFYALRVANANPAARIICIEPNPFAFEMLLKNIENNILKNVFPVNAAATADGRMIDMEFVPQIPAIGGAKLHDVERPWLRDDIIKKQSIPSVTVEQVFAQYSIDDVDILKIDVEGMEDEIVKSLEPIASKIQKIVVERHSKDPRDIVTEELRRIGFTLVYEEDPNFERYYGDLYFVNKTNR